MLTAALQDERRDIAPDESPCKPPPSNHQTMLAVDELSDLVERHVYRRRKEGRCNEKQDRLRHIRGQSIVGRLVR